MKNLFRPLGLVEKIILEPRLTVWVALSSGGCGILAHAMVGRHDEDFRETRSIGLEFAYRVVQTMRFASSPHHVSTPQILINTANAVINDPKNIYLFGTTWQYLPEGVEICSVGTTSVLVFEGGTIHDAIIPHSVANEVLRSEGYQVSDPRHQRIPTHALGCEPNGCNIDDVRVICIPLLPTTTIAIIEDRRLADAILEAAVPRNELSSFIEAWIPPGKRIRTSVLLSL